MSPFLFKYVLYQQLLYNLAKTCTLELDLMCTKKEIDSCLLNPMSSQQSGAYHAGTV